MDLNVFVLRNGVSVLAGPDGEPLHFVSYAQADRRAAVLRAENVDANAYQNHANPLRRVWYVAVTR